jgi:hypothetical protein
MTIIKPGLHAAGDLPLHPTLTHPKTSAPIRALGFRRNGQAIWPALGASPDDGGSDGEGQGADGGQGGGQGESGGSGQGGEDEPLGPGGKKALREEREARKALEKKLAELAPLAALKPLADLLGDKPSGNGQTDLEQLTERLNKHDAELAAERAARWRAEVQAEKGLTAKQAARLVGSTKDELLADADELLATFGSSGQPEGEQPPARRPGMRPDPAQGARPGQKTSSLDAGRSLYAERHKTKTTT